MDHPDSTSTAGLLTQTIEDLSPLEQDLLEEYERLAENMKKVWHAQLLLAIFQ
jgi:DASH complex subunit DAD3